MLPEEFATKIIGLKPNSKGDPVLAMTFSAVIDDDGNISEYKVQPSYIRRIQAVTYNEANIALDNKIAAGSLSETSKIPSLTGNSELSSGASQDFQRLQKIAQRHLEMRVKNGSFFHDMPTYDVKISPRELPRFPAIPNAPKLLLSREADGSRHALEGTFPPYLSLHLKPTYRHPTEW